MKLKALSNKTEKIIHFKPLQEVLKRIINKIQLVILAYYKDEKIVRTIKKISKEKHFTMRPNEYYMIYSFVKTLSKSLKGDIAEVGVYGGHTAKIICETKGNRNLFLFDTFEGLPQPSNFDEDFKKGDYAETYETVKKYLSQYENVFLHKGRFPKETADKIKNKKFFFVHLDVDLYKSTLDCLNFFHPRMVEGGVILSHDYSRTNGVQKAFDEFFGDKKENIFELPESQCYIIKSKK